MVWIVRTPSSRHGPERCSLPPSKGASEFGEGSIWQCGCGRRYRFHGCLLNVDGESVDDWFLLPRSRWGKPDAAAVPAARTATRKTLPKGS